MTKVTAVQHDVTQMYDECEETFVVTASISQRGELQIGIQPPVGEPVYIPINVWNIIPNAARLAIEGMKNADSEGYSTLEGAAQ